MHTTPSRPTVLYVARPAPWVRVVQIVVGTAVALLLGTSSVSLALADGGAPVVRLAALVMVVPPAVGILVLLALAQRLRFTVTTAGVVIRTLLRTRRIPWEQIARIEVDTGWVHRGQTLVVLQDGRRIGAPITQARAAMRRGEDSRDHGPDLTSAARPTRAAIDAHRRALGLSL